MPGDHSKMTATTVTINSITRPSSRSLNAMTGEMGSIHFWRKVVLYSRDIMNATIEETVSIVEAICGEEQYSKRFVEKNVSNL